MLTKWRLADGIFATDASSPRVMIIIGGGMSLMIMSKRYACFDDKRPAIAIYDDFARNDIEELKINENNARRLSQPYRH